jgi:hypothetical protein
LIATVGGSGGLIGAVGGSGLVEPDREGIEVGAGAGAVGGSGPAGGVGSVAVATDAPHLGQNFCPLSSSVLQDGQFMNALSTGPGPSAAYAEFR